MRGSREDCDDADPYLPSADADCDGVNDSCDPAVDPECAGFYRHANGVTVLCPGVQVGAWGQVEGTTYHKRRRGDLRLVDQA